MKLKKGVKTGIVILLIYTIVTTYLFIAADRVERLEKKDFRNTNTSVSVNFMK